MELILTDGKVLNELANTDQSLWNKVKAWITNIISKIKKYYGELSGASKTAACRVDCGSESVHRRRRANWV